MNNGVIFVDFGQNSLQVLHTSDLTDVPTGWVSDQIKKTRLIRF